MDMVGSAQIPSAANVQARRPVLVQLNTPPNPISLTQCPQHLVKFMSAQGLSFSQANLYRNYFLVTIAFAPSGKVSFHH